MRGRGTENVAHETTVGKGTLEWRPMGRGRRKLMKIRDLSRHAPPRQAQTNRPEVNIRSFHESSFRQSHGAPSGPVDQLPLKALIKVLIRFHPRPNQRVIPVLGLSLARNSCFLSEEDFLPGKKYGERKRMPISGFRFNEITGNK